MSPCQESFYFQAPVPMAIFGSCNRLTSSLSICRKKKEPSVLGSGIGRRPSSSKRPSLPFHEWTNCTSGALQPLICVLLLAVPKPFGPKAWPAKGRSSGIGPSPAGRFPRTWPALPKLGRFPSVFKWVCLEMGDPGKVVICLLLSLLFPQKKGYP